VTVHPFVLNKTVCSNGPAGWGLEGYFAARLCRMCSQIMLGSVLRCIKIDSVYWKQLFCLCSRCLVRLDIFKQMHCRGGISYHYFSLAHGVWWPFILRSVSSATIWYSSSSETEANARSVSSHTVIDRPINIYCIYIAKYQVKKCRFDVVCV
jgi:hypothetical protein